jgi:hypothetical protein
MDGEHLYIENLSTFMALGVRKVILKMTFKKYLTLNNIFHVANTRMNLISDSLLIKNGFKLVFENDKFILS